MKLATWITIPLILAAAPAALAQSYSVTNLGTLGGPAEAWGLNDSGAIVGACPRSGDDMFRGVLFSAGNAPIAPAPGDLQTFARALDEAGVAYGVSFRSGAPGEHAVFSDGVQWGVLPAFSPRAARGGLVVGSREVADGAGWRSRRACVLAAGVLTDLASLGGANAEAMGVGPQGWVVGHSFTAAGLRPRACLWVGGAPRDLGTLGGASASAQAINASREVVGVSDNAAGMPRAFRFTLDPNGNVLTRADLGALGTGTRAYSHAHALNDAGDVVGASDGRAFLHHAGAMVDLNTRIPADSRWFLRSANAINNAGQIVGSGVYKGAPAAFLLTPVPACDPDLNQDGNADQDDVAYLVNVVAGGPNPGGIDPDVNRDGNVDQDDVAYLVNVIAGGGC